jgi:phosphatidylserine/phosphatidylglycerophosphate/cardiolipin synthase-like enzyme
MNQKDIVVPIAMPEIRQCMITPPWFVQHTEFPPAQATYTPLVNGEEAFAAVHHAIANAKKSVDIICWGFQPSMYFIRDGKSPCIGELLVKISRENKVQVRILGWEMPLNSAGIGGEANLPGKGTFNIKDRAGQSATEKQYAYDRQWFKTYSFTDGLADFPDRKLPVLGGLRQALQVDFKSPLFVSRGFNTAERAEVAYRAALGALDKDLSAQTVATMAVSVTHHQKTVLVDYELPESAVGFVMGHNMLDEYWDTDDHASTRRAGSSDPMRPNEGACGYLPRQDISCQVTGPILKGLYENFAHAWLRETEQDLLASRTTNEAAGQLKPRAGYGTPVMAQLLRTQAQEERFDIEKLYLQVINHATQFIYIENQYFRWPPLAEAIKAVAAGQTGAGRDPGKHGALHLFVITNVTEQGIGAGTVNTQRMLESLGRADTIPELTKLRRIEALRREMGAVPAYPSYTAEMATAQSERNTAFEQKAEEIRKGVIVPESRPGLKVHVCSLVAKDSPPEKWMPVYVHSKLMIIDDVFTTHGSANINTRSMQVDSEMNIAHENARVSRALRQRLWAMHTSGKGVQDDAAEAFDAWKDLIRENKKLQNTKEAMPTAPLIEFLYNETTLKDLD